ncbi:MAG: DUF1549 domain-containing protein [Deltaproteobacteria bacterium]|nr:DUF1549 domain-containing protein [Deltaproteobacteria bacterium]
MTSRMLGSLLGLLLLLLPSLGAAQDALLDNHRWLRAVSLDLRGAPPTPEEHARVAAGESVESLIDEWLATPEFASQVVRHHRSLLWPNVSDIRLLSNRQRLLYRDGVYYRYLVAPHYRGGPVSCGDFEASWDANGELVTTTDENGWTQEGWVEVTPYWNPDIKVKVCAFEAQEALYSPWGTKCNTYESRYDPHCGCGPNLAWCDTFNLGHNGGNPNPPVAVAIVGDMERRISRVIEQDLSYLEVLTGRTMYVNGPLVHFLKYQTQVPAHIRFNEVPVDPALLPELAFEDEDTWVELTLGPEQSGVLTSTAYLMKFQTRRGRANRFHNAFLCQPFQAPADGLSGLDDPDPPIDLTERDGCRYCHALLEPAAAHWGRFGEYGAGYLDPEDYSPYREDCAWCAQTGESCSPECRNYYVVDPISSEEDPWVGWMQSYEFIESRHQENIELGPQLLVASGVVDGRLPRCVAQKTAGWLLGRDLAEVEEDWLDEIAGRFADGQFNYKALVRDILTSERYRRVR